MCQYQIILTPDLENACHAVANELDLSIEQLLSAAVQLSMERLTLEQYESAADLDRICSNALRLYMQRLLSDVPATEGAQDLSLRA